MLIARYYIKIKYIDVLVTSRDKCKSKNNVVKSSVDTSL